MHFNDENRLRIHAVEIMAMIFLESAHYVSKLRFIFIRIRKVVNQAYGIINSFYLFL